MMLKANWTVGHKPYLEGAQDRYGDVVDTWGPEVPLKVYSIAPRGSTEPDEAGRTAVISGFSILAPVNAIGPHDRLVIDDEDYEVQGNVQDWNRGPFGWQPGVEVLVERAEG